MSELKNSFGSYYHTLDSLPFEKGAKGVPLMRKSQGKYSLLTDLPLPAAVVSESAITHNASWMQTYANQSDVLLAPHGKTTMSPQLFKAQIAQGAWGLTLATPAQALIAAEASAKRIILANQVVGWANINAVLDIIEHYQTEVYPCVDSPYLVEQWQEAAKRRGLHVSLLVELGVKGGRCGCRTHQQVKALAQHIAQSENLMFAGIEFYEGVIHAEHEDDDVEPEVRKFVNSAVELAESLQSLSPLEKPIITGAGSVWYDVVAEAFAGKTTLTTIIRPGCYLIHDDGIYQESQSAVMNRARRDDSAACHLNGDLISALTIYAHVISVPEKGKAVIGLGKRDVAFDAGLPKAIGLYRDGQQLPLPSVSSTDIMDQHLFLNTMYEGALRVGDIMVFSTSHPCLTFDKWRYIGVETEPCVITKWLDTYF
ncbi:alanine racemase [Enterovibrio nigricans]|uniref:D-serine dehydratase n=1 Tax=Enterovibrio nigricans DSM 22720 TaxID=1121868 RepID=A0A1T4UG06_9GAMM|nr:alanine racemase [Enterovibrio nigricans]PKF51073.1 amino acid deaminase [Enterovibrio nigricans]SKA51530.1 D-serine dehydratase [Enterovibrio nigricans DSM 22720]